MRVFLAEATNSSGRMTKTRAYSPFMEEPKGVFLTDKERKLIAAGSGESDDDTHAKIKVNSQDHAGEVG